MGYNTAKDISDSAKMGMIKMEVALMYHLRNNHYPPVPSSMIKPCQRAINYANQGEWEHNIKLPDGITWKGKKLAPVSAIISAHHLDCFLEESEDY